MSRLLCLSDDAAASLHGRYMSVLRVEQVSKQVSDHRTLFQSNASCILCLITDAACALISEFVVQVV